MAQRTCQNSCVGYDGKSVLQDLSFEALAGDYLCMAGENGSGNVLGQICPTFTAIWFVVCFLFLSGVRLLMHAV